jgi:tetratricopeptide (TPR) repeat protein
MRQTVLCLTVIAVLGHASVGKDAAAWVGKQVVIRDGAVLRVGDQVVREFVDLHVYRVNQTNGDWLWLNDEENGVKGWVKTESAIPMDQAIAYFSAEIKATPDQSRWYVKRGLLWRLKSEYDIALGDVNEAVRLEPTNESARLSRCKVYQDKKMYDEVIEDATEVLHNNPQSGYAYFHRAYARLAKNDLDGAIGDSNQALRLGETSAATFLIRGIAWGMKGDLDKGIGDLTQSIKLKPDWALAYRKRGTLWCKQQSYNNAAADFRRSLSLAPLDPEAHVGLSTIYRVQKQYELELFELDLCIKINPNDAMALHSRAWLRASCADDKLRNGPKALRDATAACELTNYSEPWYLASLAAAFAECGDFEKALQWQQKAQAMFPADRRDVFQPLIDRYRQKKPYRVR